MNDPIHAQWTPGNERDPHVLDIPHSRIPGRRARQRLSAGRIRIGTRKAGTDTQMSAAGMSVM